MDPLVSVIILNYNQPEVTLELLVSLKEMYFKNIEIIVVDNGSEEDPYKLFTSTHPDIIFIRSNKNLGYAGGNNLGIRSAKGEYILILNNDTEVEQDFIEKLLIPFEQFKNVGIACPKIKYFNNPNLIQYAGFNRVNALTGRNSAVGSKIKDHGQFDDFCETHYAHGSAMMISRETIEKVGLLPENFFLFYEELDYSEQVKRAGMKIIFQPRAVVYHKASVSIGLETFNRVYFMNRNRILFMRRNFNYFYKAIFIMFFLFVSVPKNTFTYIYNNKPKLLKALYKAILWNFVNSKYSKGA